MLGDGWHRGQPWVLADRRAQRHAAARASTWGSKKGGGHDVIAISDITAWARHHTQQEEMWDNPSMAGRKGRGYPTVICLCNPSRHVSAVLVVMPFVELLLQPLPPPKKKHTPFPVPSTCSCPCPCPPGHLLSLQGSGTPSTQPLLPVLRLVLQHASVGL